MRKAMTVLLACVMLSAAASSCAEYRGYQLTAAEAHGDTTIFPLDAHNTVVRVRCFSDEAPWHVTWYRDGEIHRNIAGTGERMFHDEGELCMPQPAAWDGEHLTMIWRVRKEGPEPVRDERGWFRPDPADYDTFIAEWTENGLEDASVLPETWYGSYGAGRFTVYSESGAWRILDGGKEWILPKQNDYEQIDECVAAGPEDVLLLKITGGEPGARAVCVDRGEERYRTELPADEAVERRIFLPDGKGGFFRRDGFGYGDYTPAALQHYGADGQPDRRLTLSGKRVVVAPCAGAAGPDGRFILYGTAVANSRKVYTAFAMTLDDDLNVVGLDVRKIDPEYGDYAPQIFTAPDGTPWVYITELAGDRGLWPVLIPFDKLKKSSKTYGLRLE